MDLPHDLYKDICIFSIPILYTTLLKMSTDFCKGKRQALPKREMPAQGRDYEIKSGKLNLANILEKNFHITILNMTVEIVRFKLPPKKDNSQKIYTFQNDANINYLAEQLQTIRHFHFTSREQIYAKADELQTAIRENQAQGENSDSEQKKLLRVKELIRAYEKIVEGNYIDDLVRAQKEREPHHYAKKRR